MPERSVHVKHIRSSRIGRFSAVTFGPIGGRSQLPVTSFFSSLMADPVTDHARRAREKKPAVQRIADLLPLDDILLDVDASGKSQLIDAIGCHMQRVHAMARETVTLSLSHREQIGSTGLGEGVAIPHARVKNLDRVQVIYMRPRSPIPFDSPDGKPVSDVLVLLVPKQAAEEHLTLLAEAAQMLSDRRFRWRLRLCKHTMEVKRLFEAWPETQLAQ
jgi:PTS system nitrogen regulatory IIA component